jgi:hypothetical protein
MVVNTLECIETSLECFETKMDASLERIETKLERFEDKVDKGFDKIIGKTNLLIVIVTAISAYSGMLMLLPLLGSVAAKSS